MNNNNVISRAELLSKAKPILFNTEMVRAILDGHKTVTRRVAKNLPPCEFVCMENNPTVCYDEALEDTKPLKGLWASFESNGDYGNESRMRKAPCKHGDILYVRETWRLFHSFCGIGLLEYKADRCNDGSVTPWKPSIHMPKEAARIFLRVTDVRVERLQDIEIDDCIREGIVEQHGMRSEIRNWYKELWDTTVKPEDRKKYGWFANPWVWVIEFERVEAAL